MKGFLRIEKFLITAMLLLIPVGMAWSQGSLITVSYTHNESGKFMSMHWEQCNIQYDNYNGHTSLTAKVSQEALLTQKQLSEIWIRAIADVGNDSCYTANAIRQFLNHFKVEGYALPKVFSSREDENKVVRYMQKICEKGKKAKNDDKELWKQYYMAYLADIYVHEVEMIARKEKEEETIKDSIARNDWSKSSTWVALKDYCGQDYSLKDDAAIYGEFIEKYGLDLEKIYKEWGCCWDGLHAISEKFIKDSLFGNYKTILTEINYRPSVPKILGFFYGNDYNREYRRLEDSVLYSFFLKENKIVDELRRLKEKLSEIDTSRQRKLWYVCNNCNNFKERLNDLKNQSSINYTSNGVLKDTVDINGIMYIANIPYITENGMLMPNGACSVRLFCPQFKDATGEAFYRTTVDITLTITVNKGKASGKSLKGYICEWNENTAAGKGKDYWGARRAIAAAKPVIKKRMTINNEKDVMNSQCGRDYDIMKTIVTYGCSKTMWERINGMKTWEEDYLKSISSMNDIWAAYIYTGEQLYLEMAHKRPFIPIDFSGLK